MGVLRVRWSNGEAWDEGEITKGHVEILRGHGCILCDEATLRTECGTTDLFKIGKGVCQGYILSLCLFNFYAEYIM